MTFIILSFLYLHYFSEGYSIVLDFDSILLSSLPPVFPCLLSSSLLFSVILSSLLFSSLLFSSFLLSSFPTVSASLYLSLPSSLLGGKWPQFPGIFMVRFVSLVSQWIWIRFNKCWSVWREKENSESGMFCFVLFCFVLFCFVLFFLFCFVLFCFVLFCFVLFCFVLFCFVLFCFVLFCLVLFCFMNVLFFTYV
jgi:hypothetical protein